MNPPECQIASPHSSSGVRLAAKFLFTTPDANDAVQVRWSRAGRWFCLWGLVIGLAYVFAYWAAWSAIGEYEKLRLVPVAVIVLLDFAWLGHRQAAGLASVHGDAFGEESKPGAVPLRTLVLVMALMLLKFALLVYVPRGGRTWPPGWREGFLGLCPGPVYVPLVLMPFWGRWSMLLAMSIGRVSDGASVRLRQLAGGARLAGIMVFWLLGTALTVAWCCPAAEQIPRGLVIALGVILTSYLAAFVLARRYGGQTEATLNAVGALAEVSFLLFYLPNARSIYWY